MTMTVETGFAPESTTTEYKSPTRRTYESLLGQFRGFVRVSAESIVKRAEILYEAKTKLPEKSEQAYSFRGFCKALGFSSPKSSTVRKWLSIGEEASRFYPVIERLPDSWTTIEKLSRLSHEDFERVVADERFSQKMTAKEVDAICPPTETKVAKDAKAKASSTKSETGAVGTEPVMVGKDKGDVVTICVHVTLADLDDGEKESLCSRLLALSDEFGVEIEGLKLLLSRDQKLLISETV